MERPGTTVGAGATSTGRIPRHTGRVIVVDDNERVLLFGMDNPEGPGRQWITPGGVRYDVRDEFWLLRTTSFTPNTSGMVAGEEDALSMHRWWPVAELSPTREDVILPVGLGELTADVLANGPPGEPVRLTDEPD